MKKVLLFITMLTFVFTLSSCKTQVEKHNKSLSKYDNYVITLGTTYEISGIENTEEIYYYVDNDNDAVCITAYDPINLQDKSASQEASFGCLGMQLEIDDEMYYYDGEKAYLFADEQNADIESIFLTYFDLEVYEENDGVRSYEKSIKIGDLEYDMLSLIGILQTQATVFADVEVIVSMEYSEKDNRFTELKVDFVDFINEYYEVIGNTATATKAYTTITYDYFDKNYSLAQAIPASSIDDYPDNLATAEITGYTVIEDQGEITGNFLDGEDSDVIQFDASGPNEYIINFEVEGDLIVIYTIANSNEQIVAQGSFDLVFGYSTTLELTEAGSYYILINLVESDDFLIDYTLTID